MDLDWDRFWGDYIDEDHERFGTIDLTLFPKLGGQAEHFQPDPGCQYCIQNGGLCDWHKAVGWDRSSAWL